MLQIKNITKKYKTGDLIQTALDGVSLNLRDNEFVAVLGPSGSGKTTLLNVIGGLDRYDSGDLIIGGVSTKKYRDRDWDSYRNHTIGFVFQSYNLIPHQSVLANVELALTISGISRAERRRRAKEALTKVGLGDQLHKRPNQMSGGQMQRVAIARALVNDPDILLADEPTGALDTDTSVQVMELLREVAADRLVVMVTHNPDLAGKYANRIVRLCDGRITDDTNPLTVDETKLAPPAHRGMGRSSMSFATALTLSFNNLLTKKARTLLTAFAGSIGIIGIALILSLSTGVNNYITDIQKDTMTSYPITISAETFDLTSVLTNGREMAQDEEKADHELDAVYSDVRAMEMASTMTTSITENNLTEFKKYLDNPQSDIHNHIGENGIVYSYSTRFGVYSRDPDGVFLNTDGSGLNPVKNGTQSQMMSMYGMQQGGNANFTELLPGKDTAVSTAVTDSYDLLCGTWPEEYDETVLILDKNNEIPATTLYELGFLPSDEYRDLVAKILSGEEVTLDRVSIGYDEILEKEFIMIPACDTYIENDNGTFSSVADDEASLEALAADAVKLKITGVVRRRDEQTGFTAAAAVGYTKALTDYIIEHTENSAVVGAQRADDTVNILTGLDFTPADDSAKAADAVAYLSSLGVSEKAKFGARLMQSAPEQAAQMSETELAAALDAYLAGEPSAEMLISVYNTYLTGGSYEDNLASFGVVSLDAPSSVSLYADSFEDKDAISACIDDYNAGTGEENEITYTDYVGLLMSSVTTIINVISYVLIAFVAVSLVVSSIMIGIITYISVLERTKEIGILRAIGASKRNISQVFNAETIIIGLISGLIGIGVTLLTLIPGNALIHSLAQSSEINASLPPLSALILVLLSVLLTFIGGLIPAKKAAKRDPVIALRSE